MLRVFAVVRPFSGTPAGHTLITTSTTVVDVMSGRWTASVVWRRFWMSLSAKFLNSCLILRNLRDLPQVKRRCLFLRVAAVWTISFGRKDPQKVNAVMVANVQSVVDGSADINAIASNSACAGWSAVAIKFSICSFVKPGADLGALVAASICLSLDLTPGSCCKSILGYMKVRCEKAVFAYVIAVDILIFFPVTKGVAHGVSSAWLIRNVQKSIASFASGAAVSMDGLLVIAACCNIKNAKYLAPVADVSVSFGHGAGPLGSCCRAQPGCSRSRRAWFVLKARACVVNHWNVVPMRLCFLNRIAVVRRNECSRSIDMAANPSGHLDVPRCTPTFAGVCIRVGSRLSGEGGSMAVIGVPRISGRLMFRDDLLVWAMGCLWGLSLRRTHLAIPICVGAPFGSWHICARIW